VSTAVTPSFALEALVWKAIAGVLITDAADEGTYLPTDPVILAYNHARNGRYAEAMEVLAWASA